MIIVSEELKELIGQKSIVSASAYDTFSITLKLDKYFKRYRVATNDCIDLTNGFSNFDIENIEVENEYIVKPKDVVLACSQEYIRMPRGFMGFLQTKGSLARLFVMVHCCDGQVEPGFEGKITFEICNLGNFPVKLNVGQAVAQLFIHKVSSKRDRYNGKYNKSDKPTHYIKSNEK